MILLSEYTMSKLAYIALASIIALTGCNTTQIANERTMIVEGEKVNVRIQNINSFEVEIAPRKAICPITTSTGDTIDGECLQYRRTFEKNFNTLSGDIEGFEYEAGYRYVLNLKQTAMVNKDTNEVVPVWSLNRIISKTSEKISQ